MKRIMPTTIQEVIDDLIKSNEISDHMNDLLIEQARKSGNLEALSSGIRRRVQLHERWIILKTA